MRRERQITRAVAIFFVLAVKCALPQNTPPWEVSGTVYGDAEKPLPKLRVFASGPSRIRVAQTDSQGHFALHGEVPGQYTVSVMRAENAVPPRSHLLTLTAGARVTLEFHLPKGGVISGRVLDPDRRPVSGLIVRALRKTEENGNVRLFEENGDRTNDRGEYRLPFLREGSYVILAAPLLRSRAQAPNPDHPESGYGRSLYPGVDDLDSATPVTVKAGEEKSGFDIAVRKQVTHCITFTPGPSLAGDNLAFELIPEAVGEELAIAGEPMKLRKQTSVCGLTSGNYRLAVRAIAHEVAGRLTGSVEAAVAINKRDVSLGELETNPGTPIHGTLVVQNKTDAAVPAGLQVRLVSPHRDVQTLFLAPAAVGTDGAFATGPVFGTNFGLRVDGIPAGYYVVSTLQAGRDVSQSGWEPGRGDVLITLSSEGASVSGKVLDPAGKAVPSGIVFLLSKDTSVALRSARTDQNGTFRMTGIKPGDYQIVAVPDLVDGEESDQAFVQQAVRNGGQDLQLSPNDARQLALTLAEPR